MQNAGPLRSAGRWPAGCRPGRRAGRPARQADRRAGRALPARATSLPCPARRAAVLVEPDRRQVRQQAFERHQPRSRGGRVALPGRVSAGRVREGERRRWRCAAGPRGRRRSPAPARVPARATGRRSRPRSAAGCGPAAASIATTSQACSVDHRRLDRDRLAAPGQRVGPHAVDLLGREGRRHLQPGARRSPREAGGDRRRVGPRALVGRRGCRARPVARVGGDAEPDRRRRRPWAGPEKNCASRVARPITSTRTPVAIGSSVPVWPTARVPRRASAPGDDVVRGRPFRLVDDEDAVHQLERLHGAVDGLEDAAARPPAWRTEGRSPGTVQPDAFLWPPPPNCLRHLAHVDRRPSSAS